VSNARNLTTEIKTLNEKLEIIRQNAQVVDEDFKDFNFSFEKFIETKNASFMEIWERLQEKQFCLTSSVDALHKATIVKSSVGTFSFDVAINIKKSYVILVRK